LQCCLQTDLENKILMSGLVETKTTLEL